MSLFWMHRTIARSREMEQGYSIEPAMFCLPLRPGLKRFRAEFGRKGVEAFADMDGIALGFMVVKESMVSAMSVRASRNPHRY